MNKFPHPLQRFRPHEQDRKDLHYQLLRHWYIQFAVHSGHRSDITTQELCKRMGIIRAYVKTVADGVTFINKLLADNPDKHDELRLLKICTNPVNIYKFQNLKYQNGTK